MPVVSQPTTARASQPPPPAAIGACAITTAETSTVTRPPDGATAVRLRGIGKRFPGVVANHDIDIDVRSGTVHAIVGENGAGKSTLMKILYGVQKPDSGTIEVDGRVAEMGSPADAIKLGIGMVFQHFMLADNLTVLENVVLGAEKLHGIGEKARAELERISTTYGFGLDPDELVETLGVGERQRVEILKVLYRGAKVIILDEPTAVLVPQEVDALFDNLRELKKEGHTLLFISHKLDEVLAVADDITVVRRGTTVAAVRPTEVTARKLAELMVGSELPSPDTSESTVTDQEMLELAGVTLVDAGGRRLLSDVSLTIHRGEVLGIAGVEGNGQTELTEVVMGMRHPSAGRVELADAGRHRLVDQAAPGGRRRLRPRGPAAARAAARRAAVGEPHPGPPDPAAVGEGRLARPGRRPQGQRTHRRGVRRPHPVHRHHRAGALGRQPAEVHRRARDERRPGAARRLAPDPRRRRRRAGRHLGAHPRGAPPRAGRAADLRRPRRADRPLRLHQGHPPRPVRRRLRPDARHPAGAGLRDDRRRCRSRAGRRAGRRAGPTDGPVGKEGE